MGGPARIGKRLPTIEISELLSSAKDEVGEK
jgi:hypothetical protein